MGNWGSESLSNWSSYPKVEPEFGNQVCVNPKPMLCSSHHAASLIMRLEQEIFLAWGKWEAGRSRVVTGQYGKAETQSRWVGQRDWGNSGGWGGLEPTYLIHIATLTLTWSYNEICAEKLPIYPTRYKSKLLCIIFMIFPYGPVLHLQIPCSVTQLPWVIFPKPLAVQHSAFVFSRLFSSRFSDRFPISYPYMSHLLHHSLLPPSFFPSFPSFHQQLSKQIFLWQELY